jgi:predicted secreted protein
MKWTSALAIYSLFWSFCLFLVLPFGVRTTEEAGGDHIAGQADSAPHQYDSKRIAIRTTIVSAVAFGLYYLNYVNGWITPETVDFFTPHR